MTWSAGKLFDEHGVAVAEEAILLADRLRVDTALLVQSHHAGDEGDQGALGEVEVGEER